MKSSAVSIKELPDHVKQMIAAGEVIEAPFSVVKELIENSIDAKATSITIKVEDGGMRRISVTDNGSGILPEQLHLAITEHATSKIANIDDIHSIYSYGFRGEALSSVASISHLTILSRPHDLKDGARLVSRDTIDVSSFAGPVGTTIIIEHLFYNTPARKKFLKARSTELRRIKEVVIKLAIAQPDIEFTLESDSKQILQLSRVEHISERLSDIYGKEEAQSLYSGSVTDMQVTITGYISNSTHLKKSRSMQYLYVNKRPIEYRTLSFHLNRAYDSMIPHGRYPAAFIFIEIPADLIDINVHPAKKEIKLFDARYIESLIYGFTKKTLGEHELKIAAASRKGIERSYQNVTQYNSTDANNQQQSDQILVSEPAILSRPDVSEIESGGSEFKNDAIKTGIEIYTNLVNSHNWVYLGIIFKTYILIEKENSLKIIDFHAAHERIVYDNLCNQSMISETQALIFPLEYTLTQSNRDECLLSLTTLKEFGFDIEQFSNDSLIINGVPDIIDVAQAHSFIDDYFEAIADLTIEKSGAELITELRQTTLERVACHSAKRSGDSLSRPDIDTLLEKIFSGNYELRCPHGRPFVVDISKSELEKFFKR